MAAATGPASSALATTSAASTDAWQRDLKRLFDQAKDRFPDVIWELTSDFDGRPAEEVWGHKAIVYARAPPSFLAQYFDVRPNINGGSRIFNASPIPGDNPTQSTFSLSLQDNNGYPLFSSSDDDSSSGPIPSGNLGMLRLSTDVLPTLFSNQLEYLYTGAGIGDAFEFLFDSSEEQDASDIEAHRIDKLRKDLVFMWRSRLYSDVRIELTGPFAPNGEIATAAFHAHRFILASRSSYFRTLFLSGSFAPPPTSGPNAPIVITLQSPPFTPPSLHFTLGWIYSGTLFFSNRSFDLDTAFQIYRSAIYLSLTQLQAEIEARIVEDMMHGLYHAYLTLEEYNSITGGQWGVGGCHCKTCVRRAPRVLEFALADDVKNPILERGARRALVGIFGEGWVGPEFASLPAKARTNAVRGVQARTTPRNIFPLLFAAHAALAKLESVGEQRPTWSGEIRDLVMGARAKMDEVLCASLEESLEQEEWLAILERDAAGFNDPERVGWVMDAIRRGLNDSVAPTVYQVLVNSILLKTQTDPSSGNTTPQLSSISPIRKQAEQCRLDIIRWLRKRWMNARNANAFERLEDWALKEISDELEVPVDDLLAPAPTTTTTPKRPGAGQRTDSSSTLRSVRDNEGASITAASSLRASVLNRNVAAARTGAEGEDDTMRPSELLASSRGSVASSVSSVRTAGTGLGPRPSAPSISTRASGGVAPRTSLPNKGLSTSLNGTKPSTSSLRPKSIAPSVSSVRSGSSVRSSASVSTLRRGQAGLSPPVSKPSPTSPTSARSPLSDTSTSYLTAMSTAGPSSARLRPASSLSNVSTTSMTSSISQRSTPGGRLAVPTGKDRQRRQSATSTTSVRSTASNRAGAGPVPKVPPLPRPSVTKPATVLAGGRPVSIKSTRGTTTPAKAKVPPSPNPTRTIPASAKGKGKAPATTTPPNDSLTPSPSRTPPGSVHNVDPPAGEEPSDASLEPESEPPVAPKVAVAHPTHNPHPSDGSSATVRMVPILHRTASNDTIGKSGSSVTGISTPRASRLFTPRSSMSLADEDASASASVPPVTVTEKPRPTSPLKKVALGPSDTTNLPIPSMARTLAMSPSKSSMRSTASGKVNKHQPPPSSMPPLPSSLTSSTASNTLSSPPRGVTLQIGIPCMISSKRSRFKAFARYIGEVAGEEGPWVGVEVPVSDGWGAERLEGRAWNDGTYGGVRYFEMGPGASPGGSLSNSMMVLEDESEERAARRRRVDAVLMRSHSPTSSFIGGGSVRGGAGAADTMSLSSFVSSTNRRKREGDSLIVEQERLKRLRSASPAVSESSSMETRGLFVRPSQVLLVMDAQDHS